MIKNELINSKQLYRDIFLNIQNEFFKLTDNFKDNYKCNNCNMCYKLIYVDKTPEEIDLLIKSDDKKKAFWEDFKQNFLPYGYKRWQETKFDNNKNFNEAKNTYPDLVNSINKFNNKAVFYYLTNYNDNNTFYKPEIYKQYPFKLLSVLHKDCIFNNWQDRIIIYLKDDLSVQIHTEIKNIDKKHNSYKCNKTGNCCRLSSSEYSYNELLEKAKNSDKFAQQFTSIFIPYESDTQAREVFPEYFDYVIKELGPNEKVYFYHCPHINNENLCSIYESNKRPQICKDFPNNPLVILHPDCGYCGWKEEVLASAMSCHAMIEICTYVVDRLETIIKLRQKLKMPHE